MDSSANKYAALYAKVDSMLTSGQHVILGDTAHMAPEIRAAIATPEFFAVLAKHGATLVLEGPAELNASVAAYNNNSLPREALPVSGYQAENPKRQEYIEAERRIYDLAKAANVGIFFPETDSIYAQWQRDPDAHSTYRKIAMYTTDTICGPVQTQAIIDHFTPQEQESFLRAVRILKWRASVEDDQQIASQIATRPGPYVVLYGDKHREHLAGHFQAGTIALIASEATTDLRDGTLPNYVFYADTGRLAGPHAPGSTASAALEAARKAYQQQVQSVDLSESERTLCLNKLPASITQPHARAPR